MQGFKNILKHKEIIFEYKGVAINLTQAIKEVNVMMPSLALYQEQVKAQLQAIMPTSLLTFEQKSPHAFIDASLAMARNIPSAQIQSCQQAFFDLPNPVCADYFFCETPEITKSFQHGWSQSQEKVKYIGTLQGIKGPLEEKVEQTKMLDN